MVGGHEVDLIRGQRPPETSAVVPRADRRRALERRRSVKDVLGRERQVVGTGLTVTDAPAARASSSIVSASADARCTMWMCVRNSRAS